MLRIRDLWIDHGRVGDDIRTRFTSSGAPVFSWSVLSDREDNRQSACRLLVGGGKYFDSGWLEREEQSLRYAGKELPEGKRIDITIRVRDGAGEESEPFSSFFYRASIDWRAGWIGAGGEPDERPVYFRRELDIRPGLKGACLYVCGIGCQKVYINGTEADLSRLDPAFTDYTKQCQYVMYPEAAELFREGRNCVGVIAAPGWRYNPGVSNVTGKMAPFTGGIALTAMLRLDYDGGEEEWICTDSAWEAGFGGYLKASLFDGTVFDANKEPAGWSEAGFGGFAPAVAAKAPGGRLEPMLIEPVKVCGERAPIAVWPDGNNAVIMDFGQNMAGTARVELPEGLKPGTELRLTFSEELTEDGRLFRDTLRSAKAEDVYISSGGDRVWDALFTYHGFRYARLEGLGASFDAAKHVTALELRNDISARGVFRCGDALVTKIHEMCVMTEKSNMHHILTDCPQRDERMGWLNDATVRFEETPYNFDIGRMFRKIIGDITDIQGDDGSITCTAPFVFGNRPADPVCSSFLMAGYELVMHHADLDALKENFDPFEAWEKCLLNSSDGYIVNYSYYGDWAGPLYACVPNDNGAPGAVSAVTPGTFMSTGYSYLNCRLLSTFAGWLGLAEKENEYRELAEKIRRAMLEKWYDAPSARMATGSQACQAFSLWLGLIPEQDRSRAARLMRDDLVSNDYNITTGNLCTRYLLDMLAEYGYISDAWKLLTKTTYPSFGYMYSQEATTIWERFELMKDASMNSHNHPMYASADGWLYSRLLGVRPAAPGWKEFTVRPILPDGLDSAQGVIDTVMGEISIRIVRRYSKTSLQLSVPFGCTAKVTFLGRHYTAGSGFHTFS